MCVNVLTVSEFFLTADEKTKEMMKIQKEIYKDHLLPTASSESEDDDGDEDSDEVGANDSDYEEEYDYGDEEEEKSEKTGDDDDEDEVDAWLKDKSEKLNMDSKKMYNCSKDLKNGEIHLSVNDFFYSTFLCIYIILTNIL